MLPSLLIILPNSMSGNHIKYSLIILSLGFWILTASATAHAVVKDTDTDGLTDTAETNTYLTDPTNYDTDGDGVSDGDEIISDTNPLDSESNLLPKKEASVITNGSLTWYIGRASGILAFILLSIVIINGLLMTTRLVFKVLPPALNYEMHRFVSFMALAATLGHIISLTFDTYFKLTWTEALIPFSTYKDFLSATGQNFQWTLGIGTIALYGIIALIATSELKGKIVKMKLWRILHFMSFPVYILFLLHGIFSGTDSKTWWMIWLYAFSAFIIFGLTVTRIIISIKKLTPKPVSPEQSL